MMTRALRYSIGTGLVLVAATHFAACGDSGSSGAGAGSTGGGRPDNTGAACETAADCYPGLDPMSLAGDVLCLTEVRDGYCTHTCSADTDCCAAQGECATGVLEVCSPFESTGGDKCFISCEKDDVFPAPGQTGSVDDQEFCQRAAGRDFICRSSGGGSSNRKICVPGDCGVGATCKATSDCPADLECVTTFDGGYCTVRDCAANADCPTGNVCVKEADGKNYCEKACTTAYDCTLCRGYDDVNVTCRADATFVEAGTTGSVCAPK